MVIRHFLSAYCRMSLSDRGQLTFGMMGIVLPDECFGEPGRLLYSILDDVALASAFACDTISQRYSRKSSENRPQPRRKVSKKRGDRAANIEQLKKEVIAHLVSARDHAFAKKELTGEPELLERPTQKALGDRVGLSESVVSRCMNDSAAGELRLYWETAADLNKIMSWPGPITKGRKA
jgi:hypothetical protein